MINLSLAELAQRMVKVDSQKLEVMSCVSI